MNAIVFFTFRPPKEIFDFAKRLKNNKYDVFVSINDNNYEIPEYDDKSITIIKLNTDEVYKAGYYNSNYNIKNRVSSRDKAFYYFNKINTTNYKHLWFIEEDVFIPTTKTLIDIDNKYPEGDLLTNGGFSIGHDNISDKNINKNYPLVKLIDGNIIMHPWAFIKTGKYFNFPWLKCMVCAIRVSKNFLYHINIFAKRYKILMMDEVLYPTMCLHNNLVIINPVELYPIVYRYETKYEDYITNSLYWTEKDIRGDYLFHPIKDLQLQNDIRKKYNFE